MILTVTLNFALDITYHLDNFARGETARVDAVARQAGGKGVNTARVLHALGHEVAVGGLAGGFPGREARAELARAGLRDVVVEIAAESRITIMVVEADGKATGFSERGAAHVTPSEWSTFRQRVDPLVREASGVVLAGSVPPGVPADCYAQLIATARDAGTPVLLDADGEPLARGVAAGPDVVKINQAELRGVHAHDDLVDGARSLQADGAHAVVVSQGAAGLTALTEDGDVLHAAPPRALRGNPTGAGDAASAALIAGLIDGAPWPDRVARMVALSAAAVAAPLAGCFDEQLYNELRTGIEPGTGVKVQVPPDG